MQSPARANKAIFFLALWGLVVQLGLGSVLMVLGMDFMLLTGINQIVFLAIPFFLYLLITRQSIKKVLPWNGLSLKNTLLVVIISVAILPMVQLVFFLLSFIFAPIISDALEAAKGAPMLLTLLCIGVLPSLFEEFWFRGIVFSEYRAAGVSILKTAIITGLFFGFMHMNFSQAIYAGLFGVLYAYIVYYTRSILAAVLAHFVNNGFSAVTLYLEPYQEWYGNLWETPSMFLLVMCIASIVMLPVLILCMRQLKRYHTSTAAACEPRMQSWETGPRDDLQQETSAHAIAGTEAQPGAQAAAKPKVFTWGFWAATAIFFLMMLIVEVGARLMYV